MALKEYYQTLLTYHTIAEGGSTTAATPVPSPSHRGLLPCQLAQG
jgi:hypothetical protein